MAENDQEKTETPTPRKRQEAREDGKVAKSTDLTAALSLLASVVLLDVFGVKLLTGMKVTLQTMLSSELSTNPTRPDDLTVIPAYTGFVILTALAPFTLGVMMVGLAGTLGQVGFLLTGKPLMPDMGRLSPLKGIKNIFSARSAVRLIMSLGKVAIIAAVGMYAIHQHLPQIIHLAELDVLPMLGEACQMVYLVAIKLAILLILLAIFDFAYQRWQQEQDLRMTKQEIKDEMKRMDGDPLIKQRRARVARQLAMQRMAQAVPKADVIVTNPTHFAVALKYDSKTMTSPKVVAKGADFMAMRIRQIAAANGVPLVERRDVARALYHGVEIGQEVPPKFYAAVAEILAYVYRLSGRKTA